MEALRCLRRASPSREDMGVTTAELWKREQGGGGGAMREQEGWKDVRQMGMGCGRGVGAVCFLHCGALLSVELAANRVN